MVEWIALIVAIFAAIGAYLSWWNSSRSSLHHLLQDIRKDYRSPEMHYAVKTLWDLYRKCQVDKKSLVDEYIKIFNKDNTTLLSLKEKEQLEFEKNTLHYRRRLVSHFYQYLAALCAKKILKRNIVYDIWSEADLQIIPKIIVPIDNKLREILHTPPLPPLEDTDSLIRLYNDSKKYQRRKE